MSLIQHCALSAASSSSCVLSAVCASFTCSASSSISSCVTHPTHDLVSVHDFSSYLLPRSTYAPLLCFSLQARSHMPHHPCRIHALSTASLPFAPSPHPCHTSALPTFAYVSHVFSRFPTIPALAHPLSPMGYSRQLLLHSANPRPLQVYPRPPSVPPPHPRPTRAQLTSTQRTLAPPRPTHTHDCSYPPTPTHTHTHPHPFTPTHTHTHPWATMGGVG